jgi:hypothetical protein
MKSESETLTFVTVGFLENAEDFKVTDDMFNGNPQTGEFPISTFCFLTEWFLGWFTLGRLAVCMKVLESLVASVAHDLTEFTKL